MIRFISLLVLLLVVTAEDSLSISSDEETSSEASSKRPSQREDVKTDELVDEDSIDSVLGSREKRQYSYYPNYYYNPLGTGSAWAAGGGLVGNTLSFIAG